MEHNTSMERTGQTAMINTSMILMVFLVPLRMTPNVNSGSRHQPRTEVRGATTREPMMLNQPTQILPLKPALILANPLQFSPQLQCLLPSSPAQTQCCRQSCLPMKDAVTVKVSTARRPPPLGTPRVAQTWITTVATPTGRLSSWHRQNCRPSWRHWTAFARRELETPSKLPRPSFVATVRRKEFPSRCHDRFPVRAERH
jgi:hypothetical protein